MGSNKRLKEKRRVIAVFKSEEDNLVSRKLLPTLKEALQEYTRDHINKVGKDVR